MKYYDYLTEFIFVQDTLCRSDVIFIPGSRYGELAVEAARLYKEGMAPLVIPSGKYSVVKGKFEGGLSPKEYVGRPFRTEGAFFAQVLREHGVPAEAVWAEEEATFTYENALFGRKLLEERGRYGDGTFRAILVCQAYHARRCLMYYNLVFPKAQFLVCPVPTLGITRDNWHLEEEKIDIVLGEVERCAAQFRGILKGKDKVWKEIMGNDSGMYF